MSYRGARRGVSVLIVLALLSITLAVSYAMMRAQFISSQIHRNYERRADARLAAYAGLSIALQKMQSPDWQGVNTPIVRNLGSEQSCRVTFATGDPSLHPTDADYPEYPYRVTLISTGMITDGRSSLVTASHSVRAVVQLVRRKLTDAPSGWSAVQNYTLYQWGTNSDDGVRIDLPSRIQGPVYAESGIDVAPNYPGDGDNIPFAGQIDEVVIFTKALSSSHIASLAWRLTSVGNLASDPNLKLFGQWRLNESSSSLLAYDSFGTNDGVYDGARPGGVPVPFHGGSGSATLDGWNDHIHLPRVPIRGGQLTILAWFRSSSLIANSRIVSKAFGPNESEHLWMLGTYQSGSNHRLKFTLYTDSGRDDTVHASSGNLTAGTWVFAAAVYDGDEMRLYKDGFLVGSRSKSGDMPNTDSLPASIGNNPPGSPRARLLRDLANRAIAGGSDHRPLTGPVHAPIANSSPLVRSLIQDELRLAWNATSPTGIAPVSHPGKVTSYRLYPGGASYAATELSGSLRDVVLRPDPMTNPLGVYYRSGNLDVMNHVDMQGVLIVDGFDPDVEVHGINVSLRPVELPALAGSSARTQLPTIIAKDDVEIGANSSGSISGVVAAWDSCRFLAGSQSAGFSITGRIIARSITVDKRNEWDQSDAWWKSRAASFLNNLVTSNPISYFQEWLAANHGLNSTPQLIVLPDASAPIYHWPQWNLPIYSAHPNDGGLRWDVLQIRDEG